MAEYTGSATIDAPPSALFDYLSDVRKLPKYFSSMTSAEPSGGEAIRTSARLPDGQEVEGEAWFRVDETSQGIEWGSQGPNDYHGSLDVDGEADGSRVEVRLSTERGHRWRGRPGYRGDPGEHQAARRERLTMP